MTRYSRRYRSPPGTLARGTMSGSSPPPFSSGNSRRSFHLRPPTSSSWNPNPQYPLPATMSRSSRRRRYSPGRPPTRSSWKPNRQVSPSILHATMSGSSRRRRLPGRPAYALLDSYGYVFLAGDDKGATGHGLAGGADNHTTAQTFTTKTGTIKVTFVFADLPCLSYFYVRCIDLSASPFGSEPKIVWSTENLALLSLHMSTSVAPDYFIYRAGHGRRPSLDPLPEIARWRINPYLVGVLPVDGGTDFVLAAFRRESGQYKLDIFRSKQRDWTTELLVPDLPSWMTQRRRIVFPSKVIALQGGFLGFVDLWKGILLCNVLESPVCVRFLPLPKLLPSNQEHYNEPVAWPIRDVTCLDGFIIRCVELEDVYSSKNSIRDISTRDLYFDSEAVDPAEGVVEELDGWRLITWSREISWDYWRKGSVSHADELRTLSLPHPDYGGNGAAESPLRTFKASYPSVCGDDIVCLMLKHNPLDHDAWILTVDMKSKTVGEQVPYNAKRSRHSNTTYIPCALNKYMNSESERGKLEPAAPELRRPEPAAGPRIRRPESRQTSLLQPPRIGKDDKEGETAMDLVCWSMA